MDTPDQRTTRSPRLVAATGGTARCGGGPRSLAGVPGGPGRGSDAHRRLVSLLRREQRIEREIQALEQLLRSLPDDPRVPRGAREAALARRGLRRFIARRRERARVRMQIRELTEAEDEAPSRRAG